MAGSVLSRLLQSQLIVDESWAVAQEGGGRVNRKMFIAAGLVLYACWTSGTTIGVLGAELVGDPARFGIDAAFPALFLALLIPLLKTRQTVAAAILGALIALAFVPFAAAGVPIMLASLACLIGLREVSAVWITVIVLGAITILLKSAGPRAGRRPRAAAGRAPRHCRSSRRRCLPPSSPCRCSTAATGSSCSTPAWSASPRRPSRCSFARR